LRALASGTVKKNRELSVTGPYAYTRNPLYLGSMLIAAGFAVALLSWPLALLLAADSPQSTFPSSRRRSNSSRHISRFDRLLPQRAPIHPAPHSAKPKAVRQLPAVSSQLPKQLRAASRSPFTSSTASTMLQ
jgi:hypothetical protein